MKRRLDRLDNPLLHFLYKSSNSKTYLILVLQTEDFDNLNFNEETADFLVFLLNKEGKVEEYFFGKATRCNPSDREWICMKQYAENKWKREVTS